MKLQISRQAWWSIIWDISDRWSIEPNRRNTNPTQTSSYLSQGQSKPTPSQVSVIEWGTRVHLLTKGQETEGR